MSDLDLFQSSSILFAPLTNDGGPVPVVVVVDLPKKKEGPGSTPPPSPVELTKPLGFYLLQELAPNEPIGINVRYQLTNSTVLTWETTYVNQTLYIEVPHGCLPDASKDAFVALLEYAEEVLLCNRAIIYFSKERNERATLIRTFMFMGFFAVQPESPILHIHEPNNVYMVYEIR